MNAATPIHAVDETTSLILQVQANPAMVLLDAPTFERFYEEVRQESEAVGGDVSTSEGREAIRSAAFKVARTKTAIDEARKKITEGWRKQTAEVNALGSTITSKLQALQDQVRKPLTDWETAEKARVETCQRIEAQLDQAAVILAADTSETVGARLSAIADALVIDEAVFRERYEAAVELRAKTLVTLEAAIQRLEREEADRAELERLREEAAQRQRDDEARAEAARKVEADRKAEEARQAEITRAAEAAAQTTRQELEDETALRLKAANDRAEAAERLRQEAIDKAAGLERQREANEAEAKRRAADVQHKANIMRTAKEALMEHAGLSEAAAKRVILAITGGHVPHTTITF